ncbi:glycosyltransferase family 2 protein [Salinisphaera sp. SPP-AMP-43]|uniref:glycosyltransferase n=1 Tax=Salinisphaera sp. SPP-AMP-43 TaxID=3121288 RepID=UPI003C6DBDC4
MSDLIADPANQHIDQDLVTVPTAVCVPVRDEAERLPTLLLALAGQIEAKDYDVCLLFDGDQPGLQRQAQDLAGAAGLSLSCRTIARLPQANAGRARRAAMTLGLDILGTGSTALVLSTDADSVPAPDWIAANRRALSEVDVVAGHIRREAYPVRPARDRLERYLDNLYRLERGVDPIDYEPPPGHPSLGGASLGFRAEVYRALGGFQTLAAAEDTALADAARRGGYRLRRDRRVCVTTASRLTGRARGGLADELRRQAADHTAVRVTHPLDALARYRRSALARQFFVDPRNTTTLAALAQASGRSTSELLNRVRNTPSADAFTLELADHDPVPRQLELAAAEHALECVLAEYEMSIDHGV